MMQTLAPSLDSQTNLLPQADFPSTLVVVDPNVQDLQLLVKDILPRARVLLLDKERDGIEQVTQALTQFSTLEQLHILSHGSPGNVFLGSSQLNLKTIGRYSQLLCSWADWLKNSDILLYGCRVGQGKAGGLLLQKLQKLTGANLAAATARVGHGHWDLDVQLGDITSEVIVSRSLQQSYSGYFDPVVSFSLSSDTAIESENTVLTWNFTLSEPPPTGGTVIRLEGSPEQAINQWDLFQLDFFGLADIPEDVSPNLDFSAFNLTITEQNAGFSLPTFNDFIDDSPAIGRYQIKFFLIFLDDTGYKRASIPFQIAQDAAFVLEALTSQGATVIFMHTPVIADTHLGATGILHSMHGGESKKLANLQLRVAQRLLYSWHRPEANDLSTQRYTFGRD